MGKRLAETSRLTNYLLMLKWCGLWYFPEKGEKIFRIAQSSRYILHMILVIFNTIGFFKLTGDKVKSRAYGAFIIMPNSLIIFSSIIASKQALIMQFIDGMRLIIEKRRAKMEKELFEKLTERTWKYITIFIINIGLFVFFYVVLPIIVDTFLYFFTDSEEPFILPMVYEGFLPEKKIRDLHFYFVMFSYICLMFLGGSVYSGVLGTLPAVVTYMRFEFNIINSRLVSWSDSKEPQNIRRKQLGEIINDHNEVIRLLHIANEFLGPCFTLYNFVSAIMISVLGHFGVQDLKEGNFMMAFVSIYAAVIQIAFMFVTCYIGETIHSEGVKLEDTIYFLDWPEESLETRKSLLILLVGAQREIFISYKKKFPLKLEAYTELMNSSYSLFMLLQSLA